MTNVVFIGTLRHEPLLEAVVGCLDHLTLTEIPLPGYASRRIRNDDYPVLRPEPGGCATGLLASGLTDADMTRVVYYNSCFGCSLTELDLEGDESVLFFMSERDDIELAEHWSQEVYEATGAEMTRLAALEVMSYMGWKTPQQINSMFPMIKARAASRLRGRAGPAKGGAFRGQVKIESYIREYTDFFALDGYSLRHERFDGTMTDNLNRAVFVTADAAIVLPYDAQRDRVLLVEQFRVGPFAREDQQCWQYEPIAGRIDGGESPEHAARREAREEAGLELGDLLPVAEIYPSPGTSTEYYYLYVGLADLPDGSSGHGGLAAEHEDIRSRLFTFDELMALCDSRQAANAPLALAAYWLARHRDRLRGKA